MKKRIISAFVFFTLLFSIFSVFTFAAEETDLVVEEIETNFPDLDLSYIPGERPRVIGAIEDLTDETSLYLYIYNPQKLNILRGSISGVSIYGKSSSGIEKTSDESVIAFSVVDKSIGDDAGLFYKVRISMDYKKSFLDTYDLIHKYTWNNLYICHRNVGATSNSNLNVEQNCSFSFDYSGEEVSITHEESEIATLDVHHTWFRTGSVYDLRIVDEIHSVYFSIPDAYKEYYENLYSVASTYTKKHTTPTVIIKSGNIVSTDFVGPLQSGWYREFYPTFDEDKSFISKDYGILSSGSDFIKYSNYSANVGYNLYDTTLCSYSFNRLLDYPSIWLSSEEGDYTVEVEKLFECIEYYESNDFNLKLFDYSEYFDWSEKTVNDSFNSISYANKGNFFDYWDDYGFWTVIQLEYYKNQPEKVQAILEKYAIDVNYKDYLDEPFLLLCDDGVKSDAKNLTEAEFSEKYLIREEDVAEFIEYLNNNDNVILYRFDVAEYYSEEILVGEQATLGEFVRDDDTEYCLVQQYLYYGFRVIDITFKNEDTFISVAVNSHPMNLGSNPGFEDTDIPPVEINPDKLKDILPDKNDITQWIIRAAVAVVGVVVILFGVSWIIKSLNSSGNQKKNE